MRLKCGDTREKRAATSTGSQNTDPHSLLGRQRSVVGGVDPTGRPSPPASSDEVTKTTHGHMSKHLASRDDAVLLEQQPLVLAGVALWQ